MLDNWVNFWFSIMKKLSDLAQENLVIYKVAMAFGLICMDVSHILDMVIYE
jgi:hypothetical protein